MSHSCAARPGTPKHGPCALLLMHTHSLGPTSPFLILPSPSAITTSSSSSPSHVSPYSLAIIPSLPFMVTLPYSHLRPLSLPITPYHTLPPPPSLSHPPSPHGYAPSLVFPVCPPTTCLFSMLVEPSQSEGI